MFKPEHWKLDDNKNNIVLVDITCARVCGFNDEFVNDIVLW